MAPEAFGGLHGDTLIATRFPCSDDLEYRDHDVLGLDVGTGQVRWRRNAHLLDGGQGTKVLVTRGGTLSALDTETGETDWSTDIPADVGGNATPDLALVPSPDTDGGAAVVAYARSSGRRQWVFPPGGVPLEGRWNFAVAGDRRRVVVSSYGARSDPSVPDHHVLNARTGEVMATFNATAGVRRVHGRHAVRRPRRHPERDQHRDGHHQVGTPGRICPDESPRIRSAERSARSTPARVTRTGRGASHSGCRTASRSTGWPPTTTSSSTPCATPVDAADQCSVTSSNAGGYSTWPRSAGS